MLDQLRPGSFVPVLFLVLAFVQGVEGQSAAPKTFPPGTKFIVVEAIPVQPATTVQVPTASAPVQETDWFPLQQEPAPVIVGNSFSDRIVPVVDDLGCQPDACCPNPCRPGRFWVGFEYLHWWLSEGNTPPLVTTSPAGTGVIDAGVLGRPGTSVLFGGDLDYGAFSGFRASAGTYFRPDSDLGVEGNVFVLERRAVLFSAVSDAGGSPIIARPRFNPITNSESATLVSYPGAFAGHLEIESTLRLWGSEINLLKGRDLNGLQYRLGFRYLDLNENLTMSQQIDLLPGAVLPFVGNPITTGSFAVYDRFQARSRFIGPQIGLKKGFELPYQFSVDVEGKVAIGGTQQQVAIDGSTRLLPTAGVGGTALGGVFALPSNIGRRSDYLFGAVPELRLQLNYQVNRRMQAFLAYDLLYWTSVVRAGDQVDRNLNPTQSPTSFAFAPVIAGAVQPSPLFNKTDFWAHGVNVGITLRY